MEVIVLLLAASLALAILFLVAFLWSVQKGQFDDTDTPAMRILTEDDANPTSTQYERVGTTQPKEPSNE